MKRSQAQVLLDTKDVIKNMSPEDSVHFVRQIVEQLNSQHGDGEMFEFATLYFP
jgi:hypothetical protein